MESLAAEVSLHCVICFDEFDLKDRPPVVLPCGHTYICQVCAKRLKRCFECREPLFWTPPRNTNPLLPNAASTGLTTSSRSPIPTARYGAIRPRYSPGYPHAGPQTPPHPSMPLAAKDEPIPLPLPRNNVLIGMMECAERQARLLDEMAEREAAAQLAAAENEDEEPVDVDLNMESKINPILSGMSAFIGTCGTYAVREPLGLPVLSLDPNKQRHSSTSYIVGKEEEKKAEADEPKEPFVIQEGSTVQVVSVEEGVYQLARGEGFVVASAGQLAKIGGPLEKSCELEGMLMSVLTKQAEIQRELDEVAMLATGIRGKIALEQQHEEAHPVICPPKEEAQEHADPPPTEPEIEEHPVTPTTPPHGSNVNSTSPIVGLALTQSIDSTEVQIQRYPQTPDDAIRHLVVHSPSRSCPIPDRRLDTSGLHQPYMDGEPAGLPRYRVQTDDDLNGISWGFGCGTTLFGERLLSDSSNNIMALSFDDSLVEDSATISAHTAYAQGTSQSARTDSAGLRSGSGSFEVINFRTSMSGHTGLNRTHRKTYSPNARRGIRMMSEHRGAATTRSGNQPGGRRNGPNDLGGTASSS